MQCVNFDRKIKKGEYPITLYHTSINAPQVCKEGLRTDIKTEGIGSGASGFISFTYDPNMAINYYLDLQTVVRVSNGTINRDNICEYLDKHDTSNELTQSPCQIWKETNSKSDSDILIKLPQNKEQIITERARLLSLLKIYFGKRSAHFGREDPVMWYMNEDRVKQLQSKSVKDVGIFKAMTFTNKPLAKYIKYSQHDTMYFSKEDSTENKDFVVFDGENEIRLHDMDYTKLEQVKPNEITTIMPIDNPKKLCNSKQKQIIQNAITDARTPWVNDPYYYPILITHYQGKDGLGCMISKTDFNLELIKTNSEIVKDDKEWLLHEFPLTPKYEGKLQSFLLKELPLDFQREVTAKMKKIKKNPENIQVYITQKGKGRHRETQLFVIADRPPQPEYY